MIKLIIQEAIIEKCQPFFSVKNNRQNTQYICNHVKRKCVRVKRQRAHSSKVFEINVKAIRIVSYLVLFQHTPILTGQCSCFYQFLHAEVMLAFRLYGIWVFSLSSSFPLKYCDLCVQERKLLFYVHTLQYVVPIFLTAPSKLGIFSLYLTKGPPFSRSTGQEFQTLIDCLSK